MHLDLHLPDDLFQSASHLNHHQRGALLLILGAVMLCGGRITSYSRWNLTRWFSADSEEQEVSGFTRFLIIAAVLGGGVYLLVSAS
jgi:hypothetical protein